MDHGRIIEEGPAEQIMTAPRQPLTRDLIRIGSDVKSYWAERYGI